jgi:hypothetical protein
MRSAITMVVVSMLGLNLAFADDTKLEKQEDLTLVKKEAEGWKYLDSDKTPKDWYKSEFDDSKWKVGQAPLGYGDDDVNKEISFGDDEGNKNLVALFRRTFEIEDVQSIKGLAAKLIVDDGACVYLNGTEVFRVNLPDGELTDNTAAHFPKGNEVDDEQYDFASERYDHKVFIDVKEVKKGKNVIAIRVHQANAGSSDLALDMELVQLKTDDAVKATQKEAEKQAKKIEDVLKQLRTEQAI